MIPKLQVQSVFNLTPMQNGILFHELMDKESFAYFEQVSCTIDRTLDMTVLRKSLKILFDRHENLRGNIFYKNIEEPKFVVFKEKIPHIQFEDFSKLDDVECKLSVEQFLKKDKEKGFNLLTDDLLRISVLIMNDKSCKFVLSFHHIIMDGWCVDIVLKDLFEVYELLLKEKPVLLEPVSPYKGYINWLEQQDKEEALFYWRNHLSDIEEKSLLPSSLRNSSNNRYMLENYTMSFSEEMTEGLTELARKFRVTLSTVVHTLWGVLLQRYNNTDCIAFGSVISGRPSEIQGIENMVGLFINTIPLVVQSGISETFSSLLNKVHQNMINANEYGYISLADIQDVSPLKNNLIHHIMAFENFPGNDELDGSYEENFEVLDMDGFEQTNYDCTISVIPRKELCVKFSYNALAYKESKIKMIAKHFRRIAQQIIENPDIAISDMKIVSKEEQEILLKDFNHTAYEYPKHGTVHQLFEKQVEKTPDHIAVRFEGSTLTYRQLNEKANLLARVLREKGVEKNQIVGIAVHRSPEMMIGLLAILKAGGAYLPIQPDDPTERFNYL
ncbi:condensation domain-containing protein, partial [Bacillus sp. NPDC077411]|uniref:condensation domain-containing protein n=1 Tax=Bacillus sp. NPDC077411 TaxID=3363947 RepID=UPI0037C71705